LNFSFT